MALELNNLEGVYALANNLNEQTVFVVTPTQKNIVWGIWLDFVNLTQNITILAKYRIDETNYRVFYTRAWAVATDMDGWLIVGPIPIDSNLTVTLQSGGVEGASRDVPYEILYEGLGVYSLWTYVLTDGTNPIADADVWVTTDAAGNNIIASGITNSFGMVGFYLASGTYYVWRRKAGYNFSNPDIETVP